MNLEQLIDRIEEEIEKTADHRYNPDSYNAGHVDGGHQALTKVRAMLANLTLTRNTVKINLELF